MAGENDLQKVLQSAPGMINWLIILFARTNAADRDQTQRARRDAKGVPDVAYRTFGGRIGQPGIAFRKCTISRFRDAISPNSPYVRVQPHLVAIQPRQGSGGADQAPRPTKNWLRKDRVARIGCRRARVGQIAPPVAAA